MLGRIFYLNRSFVFPKKPLYPMFPLFSNRSFTNCYTPFSPHKGVTISDNSHYPLDSLSLSSTASSDSHKAQSSNEGTCKSLLLSEDFSGSNSESIHISKDDLLNSFEKLESCVKGENIKNYLSLSPTDQQLVMSSIAQYVRESNKEVSSSTPESPELDSESNSTSQKSTGLGGKGIGTKKGDMIAAFTCGKCDSRMVKRFSKKAYTEGIVIIECSSCLAKHLIADNLGWFEDKAKNIEDILREKGESFISFRNNGQTGAFQVE